MPFFVKFFLSLANVTRTALIGMDGCPRWLCCVCGKHGRENRVHMHVDESVFLSFFLPYSFFIPVSTEVVVHLLFLNYIVYCSACCHICCLVAIVSGRAGEMRREWVGCTKLIFCCRLLWVLTISFVRALSFMYVR